MKLSWPDPYFPPINLLNFPRQYRDFEMRNVKLDNRARSLKLKPVPRNTNPRCQITIEPAMDVDIRAVIGDRMSVCLAIKNRPGRRF